MELSALHLLLTYQCTHECDHCFTWGSPWQTGAMTLEGIRRILGQAKDCGIEWIYFEGGEPFLYYAVLLQGVRTSAQLGFRVGIVSNSYWATGAEDAVEWLRPFAGLVQDLSISSDLYHWSEKSSQQAINACTAAGQLDIPTGTLSVAQPETADALSSIGKLPVGESAVMFRGRAAEKLVTRVGRRPWETFVECPHEDLKRPKRVHVDPFGNMHVCQGISAGNLFREPLSEIIEAYDAALHPVIGPLVKGGPAELVRRYGLAHEDSYADACHLCYEARRILRGSFSQALTPDQMYGVVSEG